MSHEQEKKIPGAEEAEDVSLGHVPGEKWEFDEGVTSAFGDMLARSIPQIEVMRALCFELGCRYVERKTDIVDLGASRGDAIAPFVKKFGAHNRYQIVETSPSMLDVLRERFGGFEPSGIASIRDMDLRTEFPPSSASLILSILTLQFTPIEYRLRILRRVHEHLRPGGALLLVEKVLGDTAEFDEKFVEVYYDLKHDNGYSEEEIERKRLSLEGILVPVTARMNLDFLRGAGFTEVDCFWRWANFAGWVAVKSR